MRFVLELGQLIADEDSLGKGFRIGHSYFITEESITEEFLVNIVENELVPLLEEYWFDEPSIAQTHAAALREAIK